MQNTPHRIVVLGGGFAGVTVAKRLEKLLRAEIRGGRAEVTLVSRENYVTFQPLLPEVISGSIDLLHAITPIRRMLRTTRVVTRDVEGVDLAARTVSLGAGARPRALVLPYDTLVVAMGTRLDTSKIPGAREHALPFRYLGDALALRNRLVRRLEEASAEDDPALRSELLTFVVAGGGFSGVECIAEMNDFLRDAVRCYPPLRSEDLRFVLLQRDARILPELTEPLAAYAHRILEGRGIEIRLHAGLAAVSATGVAVVDARTRERSSVRARTCVATVPAGPHALLAELPLPKERGRIAVDATLACTGARAVYALGDCAFVRREDGVAVPPTAQHALRQAEVCAANVVADVRGGERSRFAFDGLGKLASLGRRRAVAEVFGIRLTGLPAWLVWRGVYATKFPGLDRQVRLVVDWALDAVLPRDVTELRAFHEEPVHREHFEPGETVFAAEDLGDKVYFVAEGEAAVLRDGRQVALLRAGDVFGEQALLSDRPRSATVRARTPLDVVAVSRDAFHELLGRLPGLGAAMDGLTRERSRPVLG